LLYLVAAEYCVAPTGRMSVTNKTNRMAVTQLIFHYKIRSEGFDSGYRQDFINLRVCHFETN